MTSVVIEYLLHGNKGSPKVTYMGYFYCSKSTSDPERTDLAVILRTITKQFCCFSDCSQIEQHLMQIYAEKAKAYNIPKTLLPPLTIDEAEMTLLHCLNNGPGAIVLDGIDELDFHAQRDLMNLLERLVTKSTNVIKIFVSSRAVDPINGKTPTWTICPVTKANTANDLERFIDTEVGKGDAGPKAFERSRNP